PDTFHCRTTGTSNVPPGALVVQLGWLTTLNSSTRGPAGVVDPPPPPPPPARVLVAGTALTVVVGADEPRAKGAALDGLRLAVVWAMGPTGGGVLGARNSLPSRSTPPVPHSRSSTAAPTTVGSSHRRPGRPRAETGAAAGGAVPPGRLGTAPGRSMVRFPP